MKNKARWFSSLSIKNKVQRIFAVSMIVMILLCTLFFVSITRIKLARTFADRNAEKVNAIQKGYSAVISNVSNISRQIMLNDSVLTYLRDDQPFSTKREEVKAGLVTGELYRMLNSISGQYSVFIMKQREVQVNNTMRTDSEPEAPPQYETRTYNVNSTIGITKPIPEELFSARWYGWAEIKKGSPIVIPDNRNAFDANTDIRTFSFTRVINDIDTQKPVGLLVINIPVSELVETYENFASDDCILAYCDSDGTVISSNADENVIRDILKEHNSITDLDVYHKISGDRAIDGRRLTDTGFYIICSSKISFFDDITKELIVQIIGMLLLIVIMLTFISKFINKYITSPVTKLSETMLLAEANGSPVPFQDSEERNDEIGTLQQCYNDMASRIDTLLEEIKKEEEQRRHAERIAVQEQMKPHFLYNTLDTIGCMALQNTREEVYDAVEALGVFYRKFLSKGSEAIPIKDEITIIQKYIKLLKLRNDTEFDDEYDIEEGLENIMIAKLILQPFVENSIQHGIIPKGEPGIIRISIYSENNRMHIKVYDSGIGMEQEQIDALLNGNDEKSFGFKSTVNRIKSFYKGDAFVTINSNVGEFCEIDINIPYHR